MRLAIFVTHTFTENAVKFVEALTRVEGARLAVVTQDEPARLPADVARRLVAVERVADALNTVQLLNAVTTLQRSHGTVHRVLGAMEQLQTQLAEVREALGVEGMRIEAAKNFRDKARMKYVFQRNDVPTARFLGISAADEAWRFVDAVGYPVVLKPLQGAATQATFRVRDAAQLSRALAEVKPSPTQPAIIEEFVVGQESSFETMCVEGAPVWHSWTHYHPTPLEVMENPWIQWSVVLPNNSSDPIYDDVRDVNNRALRALGMTTGLTHLEWFRRRDGSLAVGEVAARPPGAQITTLMSRAHDVDMLQVWGELMIHGAFVPPARKYAAGACFLRGQGRGRVKAVHGWDGVVRELGDLITDSRLPAIGQDKAISYEGEGWVVVRHADTAVVERALRRIIETVRVELG